MPDLLVLHLRGKDLLCEGAHCLIHLCKEKERSAGSHRHLVPSHHPGRCPSQSAQCSAAISLRHRHVHAAWKTLRHLQNLQQAYRAWARHSGLETYPDTPSTPEKVNTPHSPRVAQKGLERSKALGRALMRACTGARGKDWQRPYSSRKPKTHLLYKASIRMKTEV